MHAVVRKVHALYKPLDASDTVDSVIALTTYSRKSSKGGFDGLVLICATLWPFFRILLLLNPRISQLWSEI